MLNSARTIFKVLREDEVSCCIGCAFQCAHAEVATGLLHVEPIYQLSSVIELRAARYTLVVDSFFEKTISKIRVCGVEGV